MVVEDDFVTTLDADAALSLAHDGFAPPPAPQSPSPLSFIHVRRGRRRPGRYTRLRELPQEVRLEYDRGRVNIAASIEPRGRDRYVHAELLVAIVATLRLLLTGQVASEQAGATLGAVESELEGRSAPAKTPAHLVVGVVLAAPALLAMVIMGVFSMSK